MHSKPQKRTAERLICRESWKSCLPAKTKARARMPPPFLQPSCVLPPRFEAVSSDNSIVHSAVNEAANHFSRVKFVRKTKLNAAGFIQRHGWACHIEPFGFLRTGSTKRLCLFAARAVRKMIRDSSLRSE